MMRDRLVELIKHDNCISPATCSSKCKYVDSDDCHAERLADYLLAKGAVVMPCKVGGKVYIISRNKVKECVVSYIVFSAVASCSSINFVEYYADGTFYRTHFASFDEIGKTVFLTREDAERALKGDVEK